MKDLKDKVAVVTGGSSGIGLGIARALAKEGTHVVVVGMNEDKGMRVAEELKGYGVRASSYVCDVSNRSAVEKLADYAWNEYGHVDLIFNNAGVSSGIGTVIEGKEEDFRWLLDVNLIGEWNGCSVFGKRFIEQGTPAHIVNTASENSFYPAAPLQGFYVATKHAILGLSDTLRMELPDYIGVSILCCGLVNTSLHRSSENRPERLGGPTEPENVEGGEMVMQLGMDPDEIGRLTIEGVKRGDFYIVTHPHNRDYIEERYKEILDAFVAQAPRFEGDEKYDVRKIMEQFMANEG